MCLWELDNDLHVHEDVVGFSQISDISAKTIESVTQDMLIKCCSHWMNKLNNAMMKLAISRRRLWCCDQNLWKKPNDIAAHCYCHALVISAKDSTKASNLL